MKGDFIIDLNKDQGLHFSVIHYPGGELQVRLTDTAIALFEEAANVLVISRHADAESLVTLLLLKSALDGASELGKNVMLFLPYLPYGRADRRFVKGDCAGLDTYMTTLLGAFEKVYTVDAHPGYDNWWLSKHGYVANIEVPGVIASAIGEHSFATGATVMNVVFPDAGARKRYATTVEPDHGITVNIVHCEKKRNAETGKFEGFIVPVDLLTPGVPSIIVDDICDGGGTFTGIGAILNEAGFTQMALYVTHGIFSNGYGELVKYYGRIYTTDTLMYGAPYDFVKVFKVVDREAANVIGGDYDE